MNPSRTISKDFFADNLVLRTRAGKSWQVLFLLATVIAIITLMLLMVNIIDSVFGYMIVVSKVDPVTLAVDGISIEEQSKEQLVGLLRANLSKGAFNKLEGEKSFDDRSRGEVLSVVEERLLKYDVIETWNLWDSIFNRNVVNQKFVAVLTEEPNAQLKFVSWLTWQRVVRPQSSEALIACLLYTSPSPRDRG